ncbi:MAG: antitoxin Xre/MbcA/ParS toxin-binding domain-containing protein [Bacteroidota bacterium]
MAASTIFSYQSIDDKNIHSIISETRKGVEFSAFNSFVNQSPFSLIEWSSFLNISDRTLQRYKEKKQRFDSIHSERIIQILLLFKRGVEVFDDEKYFYTWLVTQNIALGNITPKELLDNTFGIQLLNDELTRIEHGVLA